MDVCLESLDLSLQVPRRRTTLPFRNIPRILRTAPFGLGSQVSPVLSVILLHPVTRCMVSEVNVTNRVRNDLTFLSGFLYQPEAIEVV